MINALKFLAKPLDKDKFIEGVYDGTKEGNRGKMVAALRQFTEFDRPKALVSVKLLVQHRRSHKGINGAHRWSIQRFRLECVVPEHSMMDLSRMIESPCTTPCVRRRRMFASRRSGSA